MTEARKKVNEDIIVLSLTLPDKTLFVGVDPKWDYSKYFGDYQTLDIRSDRKPDIKGNIENCSQILDEYYDAVIMTGVYEYLQYPDKAFNEINRILKSDGIALICVPTEAYYANKPTIQPEVAFKEIQPLRMVRMNITYYRNQPYYLNIFAKKS